MSNNPGKDKLDAYEQAIEDALPETLEAVTVERKMELAKVANDTLDVLKAVRTNIRLQAADMELLKKKADEEGLGYQTLIGQIIHLYVTDQLLRLSEFKKMRGGFKAASSIGTFTSRRRDAAAFSKKAGKRKSSFPAAEIKGPRFSSKRTKNVG